MGKATRLLLGLLAFLMGAFVHAQTCTIYSVTLWSGNGSIGASVSEACLAEIARGASVGSPSYVRSYTTPPGDTNSYCRASHTTSGHDVLASVGVLSNQPCPPPPTVCSIPVNTVFTVNVSRGWAKSNTPDKLDHIGKLYSPADDAGGTVYCHNRCASTLSSFGENFRSSSPGPNGLYRLSQDIGFKSQGVTCDSSPVAQPHSIEYSPQQPPLPCPGFAGEVNGVTTCVPRQETPLPSPQGQPPGSEDSGNPVAGPKPNGGEGSGNGGSGRTPAQGIGTATGGPLSGPGGSAPPIKPNGTASAPGEGKEQAACGAPGQPPCKIDETGTPTSGNFDQANSAVDQAKTDAIAEVNKQRTGQGFTWSFALPTGCQPLSLPAFAGLVDSIDICQFQPMIHDLLSMIWIAATIFALWGMASRAFAPE